jgi:hypothetical protein
MPVNVSGDNSLEWSASLNVDDFIAGQQKIEQSIQQTLTKTTEISKQQQTAIVNSLPDFNKLLNTQAIDEAIVKIKDLQQQEDSFNKLIATTTEPQTVDKLKAGLDDVQKKLQSAKEAIIQLSQQTIDTSVNADNPQKLVAAYQQLKTLKEQLGTINSANDPQLTTLYNQVSTLENKLKELPKEVNVSINPTVVNPETVDNLDKKLAEVPKTVNVVITPSIVDKQAIDDAIAKIKTLEQEEISLRELLSKSDPDTFIKLKESLDQVQAKIRSAKAELTSLSGTSGVNIVTNTTDPAAIQRTSEAVTNLNTKEKDLISTSQNVAKANQYVAKTYDDQKAHIEGEANALQKRHAAMVQQADDDAKAARLKAEVSRNPFSFDYSNLTKSAEEAAPAVEEVTSSLSKSQITTNLLGTATNALNSAQQLQIVGTEEATAAQVGLNAAMDANPIGIAILAIMGIVEAYQYFETQAEKATEKQKEMTAALAEANKVLAELAVSFAKNYSNDTRLAENALSLAQAQGKSENEILQLRQKVAAAREVENNAILFNLGFTHLTTKELASQIDYLQQQNDAFNLQIQSLEKIKSQNGELTKFDQARLDNIQGRQKALQAILTPAVGAFKAIQDADEQAAEIRAQQAKKAHDDAITSTKGEADARLALARKNSKEELDARIADIKAAAAVELNNVNLTSGERKGILAKEQKEISDARRNYAILELNNQKSLLQARLDQVEMGSSEELELRIDLLNKNAAIERVQEGVTAEHKKEIAAKLAKDISDLTLKYALDLQKTEVETTIAGVNEKLAVIQTGSREELELKKQLIDEKSKLDVIATRDTIHNEKLRAATIKAINAKARADEKKADDDYFDKLLQRQFKAIEAVRSTEDIPVDKIINSSKSTPIQKYDAQRVKLENEFIALNQEIDEAEDHLKKNQGNVENLKTTIEALKVKAAQVVNNLEENAVKKAQEQIKEVVKYTQLAASSFSSLADSVEPFNSGLAETLRQMSDLASTATDVANIIGELAKDKIDPAVLITAGVDVINKALTTLAKAKETAKKAQEDVANFNLQILKGGLDYNAALRERLRLQEQSGKLTIQAIEDEKNLLAVQKQQVQEDYKKILAQIQQEQFVASETTKKGKGSPLFGLVGYFTGIGAKSSVSQELQSLAGKSFDDLEKLFNSGQLTDKAKQLFEQLQKLKQEGGDIDKSLADLKKQAAEVFTGTTSDAILDSITQGFKDGKRAAADFADDLESLLQNAILNSFKYQALEKPLKDFYDQFAAASESDNVLTSTEIKKLTDVFNSIIKNAGKQFDDLQKLTGVNFNSLAGSGNSLTGAIKGITEQTAELLAGQFGGLRLTAFDQLNVARSSLNVLQQIQNNTSLIKDLVDYNRKFDVQGIKLRA